MKKENHIYSILLNLYVTTTWQSPELNFPIIIKCADEDIESVCKTIWEKISNLANKQFEEENYKDLDHENIIESILDTLPFKWNPFKWGDNYTGSKRVLQSAKINLVRYYYILDYELLI